MKKFTFSIVLLIVVSIVLVSFADSDISWLSFQPGAMYQEELISVARSLPDKVLEKLNRTGGFVGSTNIIVLNDYKFLEEKYGEPYAGMYDGEEGIIYVASCKYPAVDDEHNLEAVISTFLHEIGHRYDILCYSYSSCCVDFPPVYEAEKEAFKNTHVITFKGLHSVEYAVTPHEFFANAFVEYLLYPDELKTMCPLTWEMMRDLIDNE